MNVKGSGLEVLRSMFPVQRFHVKNRKDINHKGHKYGDEGFRVKG